MRAGFRWDTTSWRERLVLCKGFTHQPGSALQRALNPDAWITPEIDLLRAIEHDLRILAWQQTKDGSSARPANYPKPLPLTEQERIDAEPDRFDALPLDQIDAAIGWD